MIVMGEGEKIADIDTLGSFLEENISNVVLESSSDSNKQEWHFRTHCFKDIHC